MIECQENPGVRRPVPEEHIGLVRKLSRGFCNACSYLDEDDAVQSGVVGLMEACERFDPSMGIAFSTYAAHWIKMEIRREMWKTETIRIPKHLHESTAKEKMDSVLGRVGRRSILPLDPSLHDPPDVGVSPESSAEHVEILDKVRSALDEMDDQSKYLLITSVDGKNRKAAGDELGMSRYVAKRRTDRAFVVLREKLLSLGIDSNCATHE